jgi:hypothetical protein
MLFLGLFAMGLCCRVAAGPQIVELKTVPDDWKKTFTKVTAVSIGDPDDDPLGGMIHSSPDQKIVRIEVQKADLAGLKTVFGPTLYDAVKGHLARILDYDDSVAAALLRHDPVYAAEWALPDPKPYDKLEDDAFGFHRFRWPLVERLPDWNGPKDPVTGELLNLGPESGPWEIYVVGVALFEGLVIPLTMMGRVESDVPRNPYLSDYQTDRSLAGKSELSTAFPWFKVAKSAYKLSAPGGPYPNETAQWRTSLLLGEFGGGLTIWSKFESWITAIPPLEDPAQYEED